MTNDALYGQLALRGQKGGSGFAAEGLGAYGSRWCLNTWIEICTIEVSRGEAWSKSSCLVAHH